MSLMSEEHALLLIGDMVLWQEGLFGWRQNVKMRGENRIGKWSGPFGLREERQGKTLRCRGVVCHGYCMPGANFVSALSEKLALRFPFEKVGLQQMEDLFSIGKSSRLVWYELPNNFNAFAGLCGRSSLVSQPEINHLCLITRKDLLRI